MGLEPWTTKILRANPAPYHQHGHEALPADIVLSRIHFCTRVSV